jgi:hypothetical protein
VHVEVLTSGVEVGVSSQFLHDDRTPNKLAQAVLILTCIREVPGFNHDQGTEYPSSIMFIEYSIYSDLYLAVTVHLFISYIFKLLNPMSDSE